jgi:hypothetical protein
MRYRASFTSLYFAAPSTTSFVGFPDFLAFFSEAPVANQQPCVDPPHRDLLEKPGSIVFVEYSVFASGEVVSIDVHII